VNAREQQGEGIVERADNEQHWWGRRGFWAAALVTSLIAGGAPSALGAQDTRSSGPQGSSNGDQMGMAPGDWGGAVAVRRLDRLLTDVNATADQRSRIHAVFDRLRPDLQKAGQEWRTDLQTMRTALTAQPTVDRTGLEQARQDAARVFDSASRLFTGGLTDMAAVLNLDQREKLARELTAKWERSHYQGRAGTSNNHKR
jgi:Spy/CpxP family protein refolding chaperone